MAGWASNSRYAFLGALRSAAQMVSYEIAIGLIIINVLITAAPKDLAGDVGSLRGTTQNLAAAVGTPVRCDPPATRPSGSFSDVVADRLGELGVPVVTDLPIGHMPEQRAVLHGGRVTLDASTGVLTSHDRLPSRRAHGRPRSGAGPHPRR